MTKNLLRYEGLVSTKPRTSLRFGVYSYILQLNIFSLFQTLDSPAKKTILSVIDPHQGNCNPSAAHLITPRYINEMRSNNEDQSTSA